MWWFGEEPWADACSAKQKIDHPDDSTICMGCNEFIQGNADGYATPYMRFDRALEGALAYYHKECFFYIVMHDEPHGEGTYRERALRNWEKWVTNADNDSEGASVPGE